MDHFSGIELRSQLHWRLVTFQKRMRSMDGGNLSLWFDIVALVAVGLCAWKGAAKGAVWQLATLGSIALGVFFASQLAPTVEGQLSPDLAPEVRHAIAIGAVYLGFSLVTFLVARKLRLWFEKAKFVEFDNHWGAILGAAKGCLAVLCVTCALAVLLPGLRDVIQASRSGTVAGWAAKTITPLLPVNWAESINAAFDPRPVEPVLDW